MNPSNLQSAKSLLLVEDDESLGGTLSERLKKEGYQVQWARTIREATRIVDASSLDLIILDVGLPDGTGFDFARSIRNKIAVPFIFVTAQNSAEYRLEGFELGAEEFIPKPFLLKELLLRVEHVLRGHVQHRWIHCNGKKIDLESLVVENADGVQEHIAPRDFSVLKFLIESSPKVVSRDQILDRVWGQEEYPSNRTVDNVIVRLRQAIGDDQGVWIRSVRGIGYQWNVQRVVNHHE